MQTLHPFRGIDDNKKVYKMTLTLLSLQSSIINQVKKKLESLGIRDQ